MPTANIDEEDDAPPPKQMEEIKPFCPSLERRVFPSFNMVESRPGMAVSNTCRVRSVWKPPQIKRCPSLVNATTLGASISSSELYGR